MAKSMKIKFGHEQAKNKINKPNDASSIGESYIQKRKTNKNKNPSFVKSTKNEETEESLGSQCKSKKRKRESALPDFEEATELNVKFKKNKKEDQVTNGDQNVKEDPQNILKTKKSKLKATNCKNELIKLKEKTDLKSEGSRDSRTIFVGNVPVHFNKKTLKKLLNEKGEVERMWTRGFIPLSDKISKKTAAIANLLPQEHPPVIVYALYKTAEGAANALTLNGAIFEDHRLRVTYSGQKLYPTNKGVFVGNLPLDVTDDEVFDMFSKCGEIVATRVVRNSNGKGRGIAYVNFSSSDAVELALKLNEETLRSREIRVSRLKTDRQMKKIQKNKAQQGIKAARGNNKKKRDEFSSNKSPDKFQNKKKINAAEFKKKILAKKLTSTTKRKEKKSE